MSTVSSAPKIGLATATIIGMNAMIGAGIFGVPSALASSVGPAGILTYAFVIVAVWFMALSLARLAQLYPEEGSFYTYTKQWGGHKLGLIATGAYLIGLMIAMGLLAKFAGFYLHEAFPQVDQTMWGIITLGALVILNMIGVKMSELGQNILIVCTVTPLIVSTIMCLSKASLANLHPFMPYGFTNLLQATKAVIFGFFGFECAASLFSIVENPEKNVPKALTYAIIFVSALYLLFVSSLILCVPLSYFTGPTTSITSVLAKIFPENLWIINVIHFSILSAIIGTIHSMIWSSSALLVSYVSQFQIPSVQKMIKSGSFNQPKAVAVIGFAIFTTFMTLHNIDLFFSLTALFIVFAYSTSIITLLTLPGEWKSNNNWTTILGLFTAAIIFIFAAEGLITEIIKLF